MAHDSTVRISAALARFRGRALLRSAVEGVLAGATVVVVALFAAAALLGWLPPTETVRWIALFGAPVVAVSVTSLHIGRIAARFRHLDAIAEWLERCIPDLRTDLRTALELADAPATPDPVRDALREALVERVADVVGTLEPALPRHVPARDLRPAFATVALTIGLAALLIAVGSKPFRDGTRILVEGVPVQDAAGASVSIRPLVSTIDVAVSPPAHTGLPQHRTLGSTGEIRAVVGSRIDLAARSLVPVRHATLRLGEGDDALRIGLDIFAGVRLSGSFTVEESTSYTFELTLQDGMRTVDPVSRRVFARPDAPPVVELIEPHESLEVTPDEVVDLRYVARDDFGISEISVVWYFAGRESTQRQMPLQGAVSERRFEEHVPFDLAPMHLQPRDEVVLFVEARDNDTFGEPKAGASRPISLRVASPEDRTAEVLALKEELFEGLLRQLGGTLEAGVNAFRVADDEIVLVTSPGAGAELAARIEAENAVHQKWPELLELFERLVALMDSDELSIPADREILEATRRDLLAAWADQARALELAVGPASRGDVPPPLFDRVALPTAVVHRKTERAILVLEDLIATHKAADVERTLAELGEARERLRELLEQYRQTRDPALREQIEAEMRRLETRMRELLERLAAQIDQLPYEHLNMEAIEQSEVGENLTEMVSALDQIRQMLDSGDIEGALAALDRLGSEFDSLLQEVDPLAGASPDTLSEFDIQMGELMDELNNLEAQEQELEAETGEVLDEMRRARAEEIDDQVRRTLEEALHAIEELRREYAELDRERLGDDTRQRMRDVEQGIEELSERIAGEDVVAAEEQATRLLSQLGDSLWELRRDEAMLVRDRRGLATALRARRTTEDGQEAVGRIRGQMRRLMELAEPRPDGAQRAQLGELGDEQQAIRQRLATMERQVGEMGERFPMVGEALGEPIQGVGEQMDAAREDLRRARPRPAIQGERSALEGLRQMRQQMQQLTQRQRQREQQLGGRSANEQVEVPEDEASRRAAYRQQVIDAMREGTLDVYQDEIRSYYESLLQ